MVAACRSIGVSASRPVRIGLRGRAPVASSSLWARAARGAAPQRVAKTVEKRLSEAYRKLAIGSRNELAAALATPIDPPALRAVAEPAGWASGSKGDPQES